MSEQNYPDRVTRVAAHFKTGIGLGLAGMLASGCHPAVRPPALPTPTVTVNQPVNRELVEWDEYQGWLNPVDMVEVRARVNGYLESVHFKEGAIVKKGDLLFVIDPRPYQAELAQQEAALNQAETRLELANNDLTRAERLLKTKAISEEEADSRSKIKRETEAALRSAKAAVEIAKLNLEYTQITAPITGRIGRKMITEGNLVNSNQGQATLLTTIVSLDPIYCYFDAEETAILKYQELAREGKNLDLRSGKVPCELELANEHGFPHKGVLDFVDNRVNSGTGTLRVRGIFDNPEPNYSLEPGFFVRVRVPGSAKYRALLIPDQAVGSDQDQKFVYVVNGQDAVEYRSVQLGPVYDGMRIVRKGLDSKDWVVVNGLMSIRPGVKVKLDRAVAAGGKPAEVAAVRP
jgi:multidrug efflux system membrane fusion protein